MVMAKLPLKSVCALDTIRLLPSISTTLHIITGPIASFTVPEIRASCAMTVMMLKNENIKMISRFIMLFCF